VVENTYVSHAEFVKYWKTGGIRMNQPSVFFRRKLLEDVKTIDPQLHYGLDYDFFLRLSRDHGIMIVSGKWANYRLHRQAKSGTSAGDGFYKFIPEWHLVSKRHWGRPWNLRWWKFLMSFQFHRPFFRLGQVTSDFISTRQMAARWFILWPRFCGICSGGEVLFLDGKVESEDYMVPEVSIVTPVYNAELFLEETINSVLKQSHPNFEMLLCEDGSKDKSLDICRSWAERDSRVFLYRHAAGQNQGVSATRNLGISKARGSFIAFLDSDDLLDPESLSTRLGYFQEYPEVGLVFSPATVINEKSESSHFNSNSVTGQFGPIGIPAPFDSLLLGGNGICTSTVMVRRSFLELSLVTGLEMQ
jgi:GT2 family glycosyltransferase